jgi:2-C-methyl-D-erythritol 2,4-cyclodiphosphate synthase
VTNPIEAIGLALAESFQRLRVATGIDAHRLAEGRPLVLGGVDIEFDKGLDGHSDGDAVAHAVIDGVLGIARLDGMNDIGERFPSSDQNLKNVNSIRLLEQVTGEARLAGIRPISVDVTVVAQAPAIAPHRDAIASNIAMAMELPIDRVSVRATTTDTMGFTGRGEGIACLATVLGLASA